MLKCDGYRMFHGTVHITPVLRPDGTRWKEPFDLTGTWLLKGDEPGIWYCQPDNGDFSSSWPEEILSDFRDDDDPVQILKNLWSEEETAEKVDGIIEMAHNLGDKYGT